MHEMILESAQMFLISMVIYIYFDVSWQII